MANTADYDAPRRPVVDFDDDGVEELKTGRPPSQAPVVDLDEVEGFDLPVAEPSDEDLTVAVVPMKVDEFRCSRCFLVHHRSQLAHQLNGEDVCRECA